MNPKPTDQQIESYAKYLMNLSSSEFLKELKMVYSDPTIKKLDKIRKAENLDLNKLSKAVLINKWCWGLKK